jgi:hypothetical protein
MTAAIDFTAACLINDDNGEKYLIAFDSATSADEQTTLIADLSTELACEIKAVEDTDLTDEVRALLADRLTSYPGVGSCVLIPIEEP